MMGSSQRGSGTVRRPALLFWLERGMPADLDYGADHRQPGALEVQCVQPQARGFALAQPRAGSGGDDPPVPEGCCGEELAAQVFSTDDLVGGVVSAAPGESDAFAGVECDEPVTDC